LHLHVGMDGSVAKDGHDYSTSGGPPLSLLSAPFDVRYTLIPGFLSPRLPSSFQPRVDQISVTAVSFPENDDEGRVSAQISILVQSG